MRSLVVENSLLRALAANPAYVDLFPFLKPLAAAVSQGKGCGCKGRHSAALDQASASARESVRNLPPDTLAKFKNAVGADELQVPVVDPGGVTRFVKL
jgi:hypothetical protein